MNKYCASFCETNNLVVNSDNVTSDKFARTDSNEEDCLLSDFKNHENDEETIGTSQV